MATTTIGGSSAELANAQKIRRLARKERGWSNNIKPISNYNSKVHPSQRIAFEQI